MVFEVRFTRPFPMALKDAVKAVSGSRWHPGRGAWEVPQSAASELLAALAGELFELDDASREALTAAAGPSEQADILAAQGAPSAPRAPESPIEREAAAYRARRDASADSTRSAATRSNDARSDAPRSDAARSDSGTLQARLVDAEVGETRRAAQAALELSRMPDALPDATQAGYPSVGRLLERADRALQAAFSSEEWVVGVVQGVHRSARGHVYLRLADEDAQGASSAVLDVVLFQAAAQRVDSALRASQLELQEGMTLALAGALRVYGPKSGLQLVAQRVDARVSRGEVDLQRDRVVAALRAAGLSQANARVPLPALPERIALVTSGRGEALHDVLGTLTEGGVGASVELFDVLVQGAGLEASVLGALAALSARAGEFDLVLVVRGGGAVNDLAWWDNLPVCEAVARLSLPVLVGIGHDRDVSALHEVARFAATPTAAASVVVEAWAEARGWAADRIAVLGQRASQRVSLASMRVEDVEARVVRESARGLREAQQRLDAGYPERIVGASRRALHRASEGLAWQGARASRSASGLLASASRELELATRAVRASDPARWLGRGYAIVRDAEGRVVRDAAALQPGERVAVRLARGAFRASVEEIEMSPPDEQSDEHER